MADNDIPLNADKLLFAQEFVNYVFRNTSDVYVQEILDDDQDGIYIGFSEAVRDAVEYIEELMEREIESTFTRMQRDNNLNAETFNQHSIALREECFADGFDAENFINYCVHISLLAEKFYPDAVIEAPDLAVSCIMACFEDYDMFSGGWDTLELIAQKYQTASLSMPTPSPSSNEAEENFLLPEDAVLKWIKCRKTCRREGEIDNVGVRPEDSPGREETENSPGREENENSPERQENENSPGRQENEDVPIEPVEQELVDDEESSETSSNSSIRADSEMHSAVSTACTSEDESGWTSSDSL